MATGRSCIRCGSSRREGEAEEALPGLRHAVLPDGILTTFWAAFASVVGRFPEIADHGWLNNGALPAGFSRAGFELTVFIPVVIVLVVGVVFYVLGAPTRAENVDLSLEAEPEPAGA